METLPPYEDLSGRALAPPASNQPTTSSVSESAGLIPSSLTNGAGLGVVTGGVIGGSGVRLPLSTQERVNFDRKTCSRLRPFGPYVRNDLGAYTSVQPRSETFCPPEHIYQSAASQLDVLLPAISNNALPSITTLRTITLRVDLPTPDAVWTGESLRAGPVKGRETLCRAYKSWIQYFASKKLELGLLEAADSITGRLALEGFLVLEEWWDPRRGLLMLTVRC